jgi:hypothetical protein
MKPVTPASYVKIFSITSSNSVVVSPHRGLLLVTSGSAGSLTVTLQDGSSQQVTNIAANTVFILPLIVKFVNTATTNVTVYGLL